MKKLISLLTTAILTVSCLTPVSAIYKAEQDEVTNWQQVNGIWYVFDDEGNKMTGWYRDEHLCWYFLDYKTGAMRTGWIAEGDDWYYLNPANGIMQTGWQTIGGEKYYLQTSKDKAGAMVTGKFEIGEITYEFDQSGILIGQSSEKSMLGYLGKQLDTQAEKELYTAVKVLIKDYVSEKDISIVSKSADLAGADTSSKMITLIDIIGYENALMNDIKYSTLFSGTVKPYPTISMKLDYREEKVKEYEEYKKIADEVLKEARELESQYEQIEFINDFLVKEMRYDYSHEHRTIHSALVLGKGVCQGYAVAFQYFMDELGINNIYVEGYGEKELHAWNYVELDGEWYAVDVTWNDSTKSDKYLLQGESFFRNHTENPLPNGMEYPQLAEKKYKK